MNHIARWRTRFGSFLILWLWLNVAMLAAIGWVLRSEHAPGIVFAAAALAALTTAIQHFAPGSWASRQTSSAVALGQVMLLVYLFAGHPYQVEMHLYFFAMLAILAGWLDWRIFASATLMVAAHHAGLSLLYATAVFPGGGDLRRVLVHAVILIVQAGALGWIVTYLRASFIRAESEERSAQRARLAAEDAGRRIEETTRDGERQRKALLASVADRFEHHIAGIASEVLRSIDTMRQASTQMTAGARDVAASSREATQSSREASDNLMAVRQATTQLAVSIEEIEQQTATAARIVVTATAEANEVLKAVERLSSRAHSIGTIVELISTIAEQTNLLALNASIEAARFGSAGGGFAVAQEVKALATQTFSATERVQKQIAAIRQSGNEAGQAIGSMHSTFDSLGGVSSTVAAVAEQQNQATGGIVRSIERATQESLVAAQAIDSANGFASDSGQLAAFLTSSANDLADKATQLDAAVTDFLELVRAA